MSGSVAIINTPQTGTDGSDASTAGASGGNAGSATDSGASFSNLDFSSVSDNLDLTPEATGGLGGGGARGANGAGGASQTTGNTTVTQPGSPGQAAGGGGSGGGATIIMADDNVGSAGTPFANGFFLEAETNGGDGGTSNLSGNGGSGGENETYTPAGQTPMFAQGSAGGAGGTALPEGAGGGADSDISGITSTVASSTTLDAEAFGGAGGSSGIESSGGIGGQGGATSVGGDGSAGGAGGAANASLAGSTALGQYGIGVEVAAHGGNGGLAGNGGDGGPDIVVTDTSTEDDTVWTYGANGAGGAGGQGGAATASFTGNTLSSFDVNVNIQAYGGDGGLGGNGATDLSGTIGGVTYNAAAPGAAGAAGALGTGQITFTNNVLTVGSGIPGDSAFNSGNRLIIQLAIEGYTAAGGSAVAIQLNGAAGGNLVFSGNDFAGNGHSELDLDLNDPGPGSSVVDTRNATVSFNGSPANAMTGFTSFDLNDGDTFVAGTGNYTVFFAADPDTLVFLPNSGNVTLQNVSAGNLMLDFSGFSGLDLADVQADTTTLDGSTFIAIPGAGTIDLAGFTGAIPAGDESLACYAAGTRIATPEGEVAVEDLRAGQCVRSHFGGAVAVRWIGHRDVDARRHPGPQTVWPIRVAADAFAPGVPRRPLFLSPDHAVFLHDALIPIRYLVNGSSIARQDVDKITYYHVELPSHDVLLAEGLPAESYLDTGNRSAFVNGGPAVRMHPDFALSAWAAEACAPLVWKGAALEAARSYLLERAELLGFAATHAAALRLVAGSDVVQSEIIGRMHRFHVPGRASDIRLVSRSAIPAEIRADHCDHRRLGVAVSRIALNGEPIQLTDPRLTSGWHDAEYDGAEPAWRWTDGDAALALGGGVLEVELAMTARYWIVRGERQECAA